MDALLAVNMNGRPLGEMEVRAVVVSVEDPDKLMRVQVRALDVWDHVPERDLPWAEYKLPIGHDVNRGDFTPVQKGDLVWIDFIHRDTRYPRITGSCHYAPGGVPNFPHEAFAGQQVHQHKRTAAEPKPDAAQYHKTAVCTLHGVTLEVEPSGAYRVTQRASGSAVEITKAGAIVLHAEGQAFRSSTGNAREEVGGDLLFKVAGNLRFEVGGNFEMDVQGVISEVATKHTASKR